MFLKSAPNIVFFMTVLATMFMTAYSSYPSPQQSFDMNRQFSMPSYSTPSMGSGGPMPPYPTPSMGSGGPMPPYPTPSMGSGAPMPPYPTPSMGSGAPMPPMPGNQQIFNRMNPSFDPTKGMFPNNAAGVKPFSPIQMQQYQQPGVPPQMMQQNFHQYSGNNFPSTSQPPKGNYPPQYRPQFQPQPSNGGFPSLYGQEFQGPTLPYGQKPVGPSPFFPQPPTGLPPSGSSPILPFMGSNSNFNMGDMSKPQQFPVMPPRSLSMGPQNSFKLPEMENYENFDGIPNMNDLNNPFFSGQQISRLPTRQNLGFQNPPIGPTNPENLQSLFGNNPNLAELNGYSLPFSNDQQIPGLSGNLPQPPQFGPHASPGLPQFGKSPSTGNNAYFGGAPNVGQANPSMFYPQANRNDPSAMGGYNSQLGMPKNQGSNPFGAGPPYGM